MKYLYAEFTAKNGKSKKVAELLSELARKVQSEEGNVIFEPFQEASDSRRFFVFEAYKDEQSFQAHLAMPYGSTFNEALSSLIEEPASVLTFLNPVPVD